MPELAAVYSLGILVCVLQTALFVFLWRRRRTRSDHKFINANLRKVDLFWSEHFDQIVPWQAEIEKTERRGALRSLLLTGGCLSLLSWAGWIFLVIIMILYRFLGRSKLERSLYSSDLAQDPSLPVERIHRWLDENC
jgi:hypothetical protein